MNIINIIATTLVALVTTLVLIASLKPLAVKVGLIDHPCSRKRHDGTIPLIGGVSIYLCVLFMDKILFSCNIAYLVAASIIVCIGIIDDFKHVNFKLRLGVEVLAAFIMVKWGGVKIDSLGNLFGFGEIKLDILSVPFTIFAMIGGINAFNMIDGIDGLAGSLSLGIMMTLMSLGLFFKSQEIISLCAILIGATTAFLYFNSRLFGRRRASIFLGDAGSMLFGFTICWIIIAATQQPSSIISPVTALWIIASPIFDTVSIMMRRINKGKSPFAPDREHFHHILTVAGYSVNQTVGLICLFSLGLAIMGIMGDILFNFPEWFMFYFFIGLFVAYYWAMSNSWKMMKIARYLREHQNDRRIKFDRRKLLDNSYRSEERRVSGDRRSGIDRRYQFAEREWRKLNKLMTKDSFVRQVME